MFQTITQNCCVYKIWKLSVSTLLVIKLVIGRITFKIWNLLSVYNWYFLEYVLDNGRSGENVLLILITRVWKPCNCCIKCFIWNRNSKWHFISVNLFLQFHSVKKSQCKNLFKHIFVNIRMWNDPPKILYKFHYKLIGKSWRRMIHFDFAFV